MPRGHLQLCTALLALTLAPVLLVSGCARRVEDRARPNVLLIVVDALRADRLECYGYARQTSPNLNALAEEGVIFADATAPAAETALSVPSLLTGRYPRENGTGWVRKGDTVYARHGAALPALAELLRDRGYQTAAFSANPIVGPGIGADRGFQKLEYPVDHLPPWRHGSAADLNRCALSWLRRYRRDAGPFFVYLHYLDPHNLYRPPEEFCLFGRPGYTAEDERTNVEMNLVSDQSPGSTITDALLAEHGLSRRDVARLSDLYDGEVHCSDQAIGELLQWLKDAGLYDNTVVVVTADHGEAFLEHGELEHGTALYQELLHVPLIMRLPGIRGGQEVRVPIETTDITPTIVDAAGLQATPMSGRSVYPELAKGAPVPERLIVSELPSQHAYAVRLGQMKLITSPTRDELYDLSDDPGEHTDLAASRPAEVARLRAALQEELARHPAAKGSTAPASREELDALRALGYIH
jgi:arylsulfatase A-like enzyme